MAGRAPDTLEPAHAWTGQASCTGVSDDVFFPAKAEGRALVEAREICDGCPVARRCLEDALTAEGSASAHFRAGIYAGTTPLERFAIWQERHSQPQPDPGAACGSYGAYQRHKRLGEPLDDACREACRVRSAQVRAAKKAAT